MADSIIDLQHYLLLIVLPKLVKVGKSDWEGRFVQGKLSDGCTCNRMLFELILLITHTVMRMPIFKDVSPKELSATGNNLTTAGNNKSCSSE